MDRRSHWAHWAHWAIWTSVYLAIGVGLLAIIAGYGAPVITEQGSAFGKT